jgi:hypothetical protein
MAEGQSAESKQTREDADTNQSDASKARGERASTPRGDAADRSRGRTGRRSVTAVMTAGVGSVARVISQLVRLIFGLIAALIVIGILLRVLDANARNSIVSTIHDAGKYFVGPFKDVFTEKNPKVSIAVNWGVAAGVYLVIGTVIATLIAKLATVTASAEGRRPRGRGD